MSSTSARQWPGYALIWRWHFYAGLFCIPFVLWLACTGSIYLWKPQVEALLDRPYAHVAEGQASQRPSAIGAAAVRAVPGSIFHGYQLPDTSAQAVQVIVGKGERETRVYVNPATLKIVKSVDEDSRLMTMIFHLHGELLLGSKGSYLVELAASWAIVMIVSGLALWWPRGGGLAGVVYPRMRESGRRFWRDLHAVVGFWVSIFALCFLISGLPWAASWGAYLQAARAVATHEIAPPAWSLGSDQAAIERANEDAAIREAAAKSSPSMAGMPNMAGMAGMSPGGPVRQPASLGPLDRLVPVAAALHLPAPAIVSPPTTAGPEWTARSDTQDRPLRTELSLDPVTGKVLNRSGFADKAAIDQAVEYGIAAHEGHLFGLANQLLNLTIALGLVTLSVSGAIMWWRRKPENALGAPARNVGKPVALGFVALMTALSILLPMLGVSMATVLAVECLILRRLPRARRWLGLRPAAA